MSAVDNPKLAVLIDADNASASLAKELLEEVAKFGVATVKRAYGDWTSQHLVGWKEALNRHAIQPIQQFAYTRGKNSTDASLIIDAMDLLYADNVDGFCLVSSDSDFTRLATRLRESRKVVYGLGERKTPEAFRAACDRFVFFEVLKRGGSSADATTREPAPINDVPDLEQSLRQAFDAVSRDNGWATISSVGSYMAKNNPSFDTRLYGFRKLSDMIRKQPFVEVKESTDGNGGPLLAVRLKARGGRDGRDAPPPREQPRGRRAPGAASPQRDAVASAGSAPNGSASNGSAAATEPAESGRSSTGPSHPRRPRAEAADEPAFATVPDTAPDDGDGGRAPLPATSPDADVEDRSAASAEREPVAEDATQPVAEPVAPGGRRPARGRRTGGRKAPAADAAASDAAVSDGAAADGAAADGATVAAASSDGEDRAGDARAARTDDGVTGTTEAPGEARTDPADDAANDAAPPPAKRSRRKRS